MTQVVENLESLISPLVEAAGASLYACQFVQEDGIASLRVMIDQEGGVNIQTCADLSRTIGLVLEVEHPQIPEKYQLVVSSPGIERPLLKVTHFQAVIGQDIVVNLKRAQNGLKKFEGKLLAVEGDEISMDSQTGQYTFHVNDIAKAKVLWNQGAKK